MFTLGSKTYSESNFTIVKAGWYGRITVVAGPFCGATASISSSPFTHMHCMIDRQWQCDITVMCRTEKKTPTALYSTVERTADQPYVQPRSPQVSKALCDIATTASDGYGCFLQIVVVMHMTPIAARCLQLTQGHDVEPCIIRAYIPSPSTAPN
jgi:hypothetical protein